MDRSGWRAWAAFAAGVALGAALWGGGFAPAHADADGVGAAAPGGQRYVPILGGANENDLYVVDSVGGKIALYDEDGDGRILLRGVRDIRYDMECHWFANDDGATQPTMKETWKQQH